MIKAVLFDLDGTLVNSLNDLADSTNFALKKFGFMTHETEKYKYFVGDGMFKLIERALPIENREKETIKRVHDCFIEHYKAHYCDKTVAYDGINDLLLKLKKMNIKMAVISNKVDEMAITVAKKLLNDVFDIVCGKREGYPTKPDPTLTLEVISNLGVAPKECLFVGDSGMDMAVSQNAKTISVGVLWGFRDKEELLQNGASYIINSPDEILSIIEENNG